MKRETKYLIKIRTENEDSKFVYKLNKKEVSYTYKKERAKAFKSKSTCNKWVKYLSSCGIESDIFECFGSYIIDKDFKCCPECGGTDFIYSYWVEYANVYKFENDEFILNPEIEYGLGVRTQHDSDNLICNDCKAEFENRTFNILDKADN